MSSTPHEVPPPPSGGGPPQLAGSAYASSQTNNLAVVSFVASLAAFFAHVIPVIGGFTVAVVAIITGFVARGQIKRTGEQGIWMANAGIIIGFIHIALGLLVLFFVIFVLGIALFGIWASVSSGGSPSPVPSG